MEIQVENNKYKLEINYKDGFNKDEFLNKYTEYFKEYDYIFGDYSYDKLRLKGFNDAGTSGFNKYNDISMLEDYIKNFCSYECRYFLLKKEK